MIDDHQHPSGSTSQLREAIVTIVQSFGYPETISVNYTFEDGTKRTTIEILAADDSVWYELIYDGRDGDGEHELRVVE